MKEGPFFRIELRKSARELLEIHGDNLTCRPIDLDVKVVPGAEGCVRIVMTLDVPGAIEPDPNAHLKCVVLSDEEGP